MEKVILSFLLVSIAKTVYLYEALFHKVSWLHILFAETGYFLFFMSLFLFIRPKNGFLMLIIYDIVLSVLYFSLLTYTYYFNQVPTAQALTNAGQVGKIMDSVTALIQKRDALLFADFPVLFVLAFFIKKKEPIQRKTALIVTLVGLIWITVSFYSFNRPNVTHSNLVVAKVGLFNYELGSAFTRTPEAKWTMSDNKAVLNKRIMELKQIQRSPASKYFGVSKGKNLIVIQVESLQNFVLHLSINGQKVMPFLDSWVSGEETVHFNRIFQQIGPGNTSDAEFMMNTSLYPDGSKATTNLYENTSFPSLPKLLKKEGYQTLTLHVDDIHFWNRDQLYPNLGWDKVYDKTFFGTEDPIGLGASDRVLFQKGLEVLEKTEQPFYAMFVTLSSHHPFKIPEKYKVLKLPASIKGTLTGDYLQSLHYVDGEIQRFIKGLQEKGLYDNSVIVLYGDHFGLGADTISKKEKDFLGQVIGHPYSMIDQFHIPLIIHASGLQGGTNQQLGGQVDFMPTVAGLLAIDPNQYVHFGEDLFQVNRNFFGMRFYLPTGSFFTDHRLFIPGTGFEDGRMMDLLTGKEIKTTHRDRALFQRILELETLSDQYLKSLPTRN